MLILCIPAYYSQTTLWNICSNHFCLFCHLIIYKLKESLQHCCRHVARLHMQLSYLF
jgi:hypothetical protein